MRELVAKYLWNIWAEEGESMGEYYELADDMLKKMSKEIKKVENPQRRLDNGYYVGFEECRQAILSLFKGLDKSLRV